MSLRMSGPFFSDLQSQSLRLRTASPTPSKKTSLHFTHTHTFFLMQCISPGLPTKPASVAWSLSLALSCLGTGLATRLPGAVASWPVVSPAAWLGGASGPLPVVPLSSRSALGSGPDLEEESQVLHLALRAFLSTFQRKLSVSSREENEGRAGKAPGGGIRSRPG